MEPIEIRRPLKIVTDEGNLTGELVLNAKQRIICDACGGPVTDYAQHSEDDAPYDFTICLPDFFLNADECGDKIEIS